eukprot:jgi/Botrbrau1/14968/Bobra.0018s0070.1
MSDMPENVLALILGFLAISNLNYLRAARLVCRSFRAASIAHIRCLATPTRRDTNNCTGRINPVLGKPLVTFLQQQLRHFECVSRVHLVIMDPEEAPLLAVEGVSRLLEGLTLGALAYKAGCEAYGQQWLSQLAAATALTRLELQWDAPVEATAAVLQACSNLRALQIWGPCLERLATPNEKGQRHSHVLLLVKGLNSLLLGKQPVHGEYCWGWEGPDIRNACALYQEVTAQLTALSNLQELLGMHGLFDTRNIAERFADLGALTGLTRLTGAAIHIDDAIAASPLSRLTGLRTLDLWLREDVERYLSHLMEVMGGFGLPSLPSLPHLPHLQDLSLKGFASVQVCWMGLAPSQQLTSLRVNKHMRVRSECLLEAPLSSLVRLHADLFAPRRSCVIDTASVAASLSRVEDLNIRMDGKDADDEMAAFAARLGGLTRLTSLEIEVAGGRRKGRKLCTHSPIQHCHPPAVYLSSLCRLKHLHLNGVLDIRNAAVDVQCLAGLTDLTRLEIVHIDPPVCSLPPLTAPDGPPRCLQPLTALRMLLHLKSPSWTDGLALFADGIAEAQREMGFADVLEVQGCV